MAITANGKILAILQLKLNFFPVGWKKEFLR